MAAPRPRCSRHCTIRASPLQKDEQTRKKSKMNYLTIRRCGAVDCRTPSHLTSSARSDRRQNFLLIFIDLGIYNRPRPPPSTPPPAQTQRSKVRRAALPLHSSAPRSAHRQQPTRVVDFRTLATEPTTISAFDLARIQFAFTVSFHIVVPALPIAL